MVRLLLPGGHEVRAVTSQRKAALPSEGEALSMSKSKQTKSSGLTFAYHDGQGRGGSVGLRSGGKWRVAFGEPGRRAAAWGIEVNPKGDVYIFARETGSLMKASLHKTGDSFWMFVPGAADRSEVARKAIDAKGGRRLIDQWRRPADASSGLTVAFGIWTSGRDLSVIPNDTTPRDGTFWFPLRDEEAGLILVYYMKPDRPTVRLDGVAWLDGVGMDTGEAVLIAAVKRAPLEHERSEALSLRRSAQAIQCPPEVRAPRIHVRRHDPATGMSWLLDLAVPPLIETA
jgi:hypothetical protein